MLKEGDRVWVNIPKTGYVGVAEVSGPDVAKADYHKRFADDEENSEYMVPVEWIVSVPAKDAVSEVGFFGNPAGRRSMGT